MLLLLLVLMKLYACFNIDIEKTVTFDVREDTDPSPEAVENMVFFTINMDMDGPRYISPPECVVRDRKYIIVLLYLIGVLILCVLINVRQRLLGRNGMLK